MGVKTKEKKERKTEDKIIELYTIKEAADLLKLHHMTVRSRIRNNHIKAVDISRPGAKQKEYRITREELEKIIS